MISQKHHWKPNEENFIQTWLQLNVNDSIGTWGRRERRNAAERGRGRVMDEGGCGLATLCGEQGSAGILHAACLLFILICIPRGKTKLKGR